MHTSVHLERKVKNQKPLNRAQQILRKNKKNFPKWFWRIREEHSYDTSTFTWDIPHAEVTVDADGSITFHAVSMEAFGALGMFVELLEE